MNVDRTTHVRLYRKDRPLLQRVLRIHQRDTPSFASPDLLRRLLNEEEARLERERQEARQPAATGTEGA